jgi:hypothetical protein
MNMPYFYEVSGKNMAGESPRSDEQMGQPDPNAQAAVATPVQPQTHAPVPGITPQ